ncbi:MAG: hypothetical protein AAF683_10820, partial [Pseudomonadota bacterium]
FSVRPSVRAVRIRTDCVCGFLASVADQFFMSVTRTSDMRPAYGCGAGAFRYLAKVQIPRSHFRNLTWLWQVCRKTGRDAHDFLKSDRFLMWRSSSF